MDEQRLSKLKGLGPKSEKCLNKIGIFTKSDLERIGPVDAFIRLRCESNVKPSLNFLYAMIGALEDIHWTEVAKREKGRLLIELDGYSELSDLLKSG